MIDIPSGEFRAYLFDCDGTIANSMPLHYRTWVKVLAEWGGTFEEDLFYAWGGRPIAEIVGSLNEAQGLAMPVDEVVRRKEEMYLEQLPQLTAVPGIVHHIDDAYGRIPTAVVSGSTRDSVTSSLVTLGLLDRFDAFVCAGDYARAKPDPEAYLMAADKLGVEPRHCLVFEDTQMGVDAATAAGMASVRVPQHR